MSTVAAVPLVVPPHVDQVLDEVGRQLQITVEQYRRAESAYLSVGEWLCRDGSSLARYRPEIYPQGSMALRTTVRPLHQEEFDLDLVAELDGWVGSAMDLHEALGDRLAEHGEYRKMLEPKKRCWTLNYKGDFHLDALPGRDDATRPQDNSIEVPDRELRDWKASNPKDFVLWFESRAQPYYRMLEARNQAPLPVPGPVDARDPLRRAVQLMKRHRDVRFDGDPANAPRSIVLTTLAANHYNGQESVGEALLWILGGIAAELQSTDGPLVVLNPVNPKENFAESWEENPQAFKQFVDYVQLMATDLRALFNAPLVEQFRDRGGRLFGVEVAKRAVQVYNEQHGAATLAALQGIGRGSAAPAKPWSRD